MTLLVRNEEDILDSNLRYHLAQGVDFIIVTDNLSTDATPAILHDYKKQGVVRVIQESADDYSQHEWVTRMARMAATDYQADWVINNDADEFWWPDQGSSLASYLSGQPEAVQVLSAPRHNFVPLPSATLAQLPFHAAMIYRETCSVNALGEPLQAKVCHRANPAIEVRQGNHAVLLEGTLLPPVTSALSILHYPVRSLEQYRRKIALGGAAYGRNTRLNRGMGKTWRVLYEQLQAGRFEEFYQAGEYDESRVLQELATGKLTEDTRLRDFFHDHPLTPLPVPVP